MGRVAPRAAVVVLLAVGLAFVPARAGENAAAPEAAGGPAKGTLMLCSLGSPELRAKFVELAGGEKAKLVLVANRKPPNTDLAAAGAAAAKAWGVAKVTVCCPGGRADADDKAVLEALRGATGAWFPGGRPQQYADWFVGTAVQRELVALLERGGVVGGESAGAMIQCTSVALPATPAEPGHTFDGFGFARGLVVFPHYGSGKFPAGSGETVVAEHPGVVGLAVRDGAAVIVRGGEAEVIGKSDVAVIRSAEGGAVSTTPYHPGERFTIAAGDAAAAGAK